jgi:hypothetical protein
MPPTARFLALVALGLSLGAARPTDAFSATLAAAPTLLGLALWAITERAFGLWGQTLVVRQPGGAPHRTRLSFGPFRIDRADKRVASMRRDAAGD